MSSPFNLLGNLFGGISQAGGGALNSIGSTLSNMWGGASKGLGGMLGGEYSKDNPGGVNPNAILGGLGTTFLGNMFTKTPNIPSFNTSQVQNYSNYQPGNINNLSPEARSSIENMLAPQEDQRRRQLRNMYANAMPGTDLTNNGAYARDTSYLEKDLTQNRTQSYMNAVNQIDQQKMQQLSDAANLSVQQIIAKYGVDAQAAQQMKQMYGNIGGLFMGKGLYPQGNNLMSLFGQNQSNAVEQAKKGLNYENIPFAGWW